MRLRWRPARMSLATKSRVLFGVAAALIIGAALFVQFQRMEQLTRQLNLSAGRAVARLEVARHLADATRGLLPTTTTTTRPTTAQARLDFGRQQVDAPRLLSAERLVAMPADQFERLAFERFARHPDRFEYALPENTPQGPVFRYAEPLTLGAECVRCHAVGGAAAATASAVPRIVGPSTAPLPTVGEELFGVVAVEIPDQVPQFQLILNRVFLLAAGLLSGLLAVVILSFIISRLILRPVRVLQETAEKVSEGDLNIRATISSGDEFQRLSETFNVMLINLKRGDDQLRAANRSLDLELVKLAETNVGLNEANRLKNEFLANVSHELRTPLNSILGFADLLRASRAVAADARATRYLGNITNSGASLLDLINDLLDLAKIEAGRIEVRPIDLSMGDLVEGLVALVRPLAEKRRLTLRVELAPDVPIVRTDPTRLQQVLYNLMSNAIKFSPEGEAIDLLVDRTDEQVRVRVVDRGPGIDPAHHNLIFEKFRQVDASATREHGGTGLGLSISRELMRLLGGSIGVESAVGRGATFWCLLPVRSDAST